MTRALIVLLEEGVSDEVAEQLIDQIEDDFEDVMQVEHFTDRRALSLMRSTPAKDNLGGSQ